MGPLYVTSSSVVCLWRPVRYTGMDGLLRAAPSNQDSSIGLCLILADECDTNKPESSTSLLNLMRCGGTG